MTQAINLANFANNLDSSGNVSPNALNAAVPVTKGGTGATTVSAARTALSVLDTTTTQNSTAQWLTSVSGSNTITATLTPAITAYAAGQTFRFVVATTNTSTVTININGLGAKNLTKNGTTVLSSNDLVAGATVQITYDGTQFQVSSGIGSGGGAVNGVFYQNYQNINASYTIPSNVNAMSTGPLTIDTGITVTVSTGATWAVI